MNDRLSFKSSPVFVYLDRIQSSYWFLPAAMAVIVFVGSFATIHLDTHYSFFSRLPFVAYTSAAGARSLLSAIAGSLITVAAVAFSMTLLALSHVSTQYGPRIFANLMRDRGNQFTLGAFTSTYIYCLLILRTVRSESDNLGDGFVPNISILIAFMLSLVCIGTLIYFFHHIPESMRLSEITEKLGRDFKKKIKQIYPQMRPSGVPDQVVEDNEFVTQYQRREFTPIGAPCDGYIQSLDQSELFHIACEHGLEIHVLTQIGQFVCEGVPVFKVAPMSDFQSSIVSRLQSTLTLGKSRTNVQDLLFPAEQLLEIATKALSPGVNAPSTAIMCLNWIESGLLELSRHSLSERSCYDEAKQLRVLLASPLGFEAAIEALIGGIRDYAAPDKQVTIHVLNIINRLAANIHCPHQRNALDMQAEALSQLYKKIHKTSLDGALDIRQP